MNTITDARTGALANGLTMSRSIRTPPMNETRMVAKNASQYGSPRSISFQAK